MRHKLFPYLKFEEIALSPKEKSIDDLKYKEGCKKDHKTNDRITQCPLRLLQLLRITKRSEIVKSPHNKHDK